MIVKAAFVVALLLVLVWDVAAAERLSRRGAGPSFRLLSGLCGFLIAPGLLIYLGAESASTGRALAGLGWFWPAVLLLFVAQSSYALVRRLASRWVVVPIVTFNALIALSSIARYAGSLGYAAPAIVLAPGLAVANLVAITLGPSAFASPFALLVPVLAPALPSNSRVASAWRVALAACASALVGLILAQSISARSSLAAYDQLGIERASELSTSRAPGSLATGLRILPELSRVPAAGVLGEDLALADSLGVDALLVRIMPEACTLPALDSLDRALESFRGDSTVLIVELAYPRDASAQLRASEAGYIARSVENIDRIVRRLRPSYVIPASDPYGVGVDALGVLSEPWWRRLFSATAMAAHRAGSTTRVMLTTAAEGVADSSLFDWATAAGSPVDATVFVIAPAIGGGMHIQATLATADRWMRRAGERRDHWIIAAGAPALEGEEAQRRLMRHVLYWAASRPMVRGVVLGDAADYDRMTGFRTSSGRLRRATAEAATTIRALSGHPPTLP